MPFSPFSTWPRFGQQADDLSPSELRLLKVPKPAAVPPVHTYFALGGKSQSVYPENPRQLMFVFKASVFLQQHLVSLTRFLPLEQKQQTLVFDFTLAQSRVCSALFWYLV